MALDGLLQDDPPGARRRRAHRRLPRLKALRKVVFPVSLPGLLTVVIFSFTLCVNEFIYAFTFVSSSEMRTVSAGVPNDLIRGDVFFWQSLMAATLIPAIPLALLYNAFDRFIKGSQEVPSARKALEKGGHNDRRRSRVGDEGGTDEAGLVRRGAAGAFAVSMFGGLPNEPSPLRPLRYQHKQLSGELKIMQWTHFVPDYDTWLDNTYVKQWGEKNDVEVKIDHINNALLPSTAASEVASQSGHDLFSSFRRPRSRSRSSCSTTSSRR